MLKYLNGLVRNLKENSMKRYRVIAPSEVELATKIDSVKKVLENIFSLSTKLCDTKIFTQEVK